MLVMDSGRIYVGRIDKILWVEPFDSHMIRYVPTVEIERVFSRNHVSFNTAYPDVFLTSDTNRSYRWDLTVSGYIKLIGIQ